MKKAAHHRAGFAVRIGGSVAARRHRRRHRGRTWGRPDGRPHPAGHAGRTTERYRMGMDRRRGPVRLDRPRAQQAAAESLDSERTIRMIALDPQPWDAGAVAAILPELGKRLLRYRLVEAAHRLVTRDRGRISADSHAADPQGHDRARPEREAASPENRVPLRSRARPTRRPVGR